LYFFYAGNKFYPAFFLRKIDLKPACFFPNSKRPERKNKALKLKFESRFYLKFFHLDKVFLNLTWKNFTPIFIFF
jgi:hypothetical protein